MVTHIAMRPINYCFFVTILTSECITRETWAQHSRLRSRAVWHVVIHSFWCLVSRSCFAVTLGRTRDTSGQNCRCGSICCKHVLLWLSSPMQLWWLVVILLKQRLWNKPMRRQNKQSNIIRYAIGTNISVPNKKNIISKSRCSNATKKTGPASIRMEPTMKLHVSLPSGRCESFVVNQSAAVSDLKAAVQQSFVRCFLRPAAPNGTLLV